MKDCQDAEAKTHQDSERANRVANACHVRGYKCLEDSGIVAKTYVQQPSGELCE